MSMLVGCMAAVIKYGACAERRRHKQASTQAAQLPVSFPGLPALWGAMATAAVEQRQQQGAVAERRAPPDQAASAAKRARLAQLAPKPQPPPDDPHALTVAHLLVEFLRSNQLTKLYCLPGC